MIFRIFPFIPQQVNEQFKDTDPYIETHYVDLEYEELVCYLRDRLKFKHIEKQNDLDLLGSDLVEINKVYFENAEKKVLLKKTYSGPKSYYTKTIYCLVEKIFIKNTDEITVD